MAIDAPNMNVNNYAGTINGGMNVNNYTQQAGSTWVSYMDVASSQMNKINAAGTITIAPGAKIYAYTNNSLTQLVDGQQFEIVTVQGLTTEEIIAQLKNAIITSDTPFADFTVLGEGQNGLLEFHRVGPEGFAAATDLTTVNHNVTVLNSHRFYELFVNRDTQNSKQGMPSGDMSGSATSLQFLPIGGYSNQDSRDGHAGYDTSYYGGIGYVEHEFDDAVKGGLGFSYFYNDTNFKDDLDSTSQINTYRPFAYINYEPGNWRVDLAASWARHRVGNRRFYEFNDTRYLAKSKYDADEVSGHVNLGYKYSLNNGMMVQPMIGAFAATLKTDSYNEKGAGPMNLHVKSDDYNSFKSMIGLKLKKDYAMDNGGMITPEMHLRWYHEFSDRQGSVGAYFLDQQQLFNASGIKTPKDIGDVAFRLTTDSGTNWDLFSEVYYQFGSKFYNVGGTIGAKYNF